jgi:hypothetical protein
MKTFTELEILPLIEAEYTPIQETPTETARREYNEACDAIDNQMRRMPK